jgi:hypothetical protein
MRRVAKALIAAFAILVSFAWARAEAQEFCVACSGPNGLYRCIIDNAQPGGGQSLQALCTTTLAREGKHASCNVTGGTVFQCDGQIRRIPWRSVSREPAPANVQAPAPAAKAEPKADEPPRTMVDLMKRNNEQAAEQIKKNNEAIKEQTKSVGEAIGSATKKTWDCMSSFFTRC